MTRIKVKCTASNKKALNKELTKVTKRGNVRARTRILAILSVVEDQTYSSIAKILKVSEEAIRVWVNQFILGGISALLVKKKSGRPPKLTKNQRKNLEDIIDKGPSAAGFPGACWRSPMIQFLIKKKFGVFYSAAYIAQLLKNMDFSFQKAKFEADRSDDNVKLRKEWLKNTWPEILELGIRKNAHILFGDEASFPQWGSLNYTWARRGHQPVVKTSGKRKGYKVFGLVEYFTGQFFSKALEGRLNSDSYIDFLKGVLAKTRKHLVVIQDGAKYHVSKAVKEFIKSRADRITIYSLPAYSPDYNPIEKLWKKIKEKGTHLQYFPTFDDLKNKVHEMLNIFSDAKKEVMPLFGFYDDLGPV
jgi:transposase